MVCNNWSTAAVQALLALFCFCAVFGGGPCTSNPCKNGGTCQVDGQGTNCTCLPPYTGDLCETVNHCASDPCQNGGKCTNGEDTYNCTCPAFFEGNDCSKNIWCDLKGKEVCGNEKCQYNATIGKGECICEDGKVFNETTKKCIVDYCASSPCKNGGTCRNDEDAYHCECTGVYGGTDCEDIVWCEKVGKDVCGNVKCVNDKISKKGYCECDEYQTFNTTSKACEAMTGCIPKLLKGECSLVHETCKEGECKCETNYKHNSEKTKCAENFCSSVNCDHNAKCKELGFGETLCVCNSGYFMNNNVCRKINPCSVKSCTQKCNEGVCSCEKGFHLDDDNITCLAETEDSDCDLDCGIGTCVKTGTESKCICPSASFLFKDKTCIDMCTANGGKPPPYTCPTAAGCEKTDDIKGFRCKCKNPYELDEDGVHCKRKRMCEDSNVLEECGEKGAVCRENLTNAEGYNCICYAGFEEEENICKRKCDIKKYRDSCSALNAICELNEKLEVKCKCPPMLTREGNDENKPCNLIAPNSYLGKLSVLKSIYELKEPRRSKRSLKNVNLPKLGDDMMESLKNVYGEVNDLKILDCNDKENVLACSVEMQLKDKPDVVNKIGSPTVCVPVNDEYCLVQPRLVLKREEDSKELFQKTEPCSEEVTSRLCEKATYCNSTGDGNFQCRCRKGFYTIGFFHPIASKETFVERCNDVDECAIPKACPDTTDCVNKYGNYSCYCKDKHKKKHENSDPKKEGCEALCSPSPCVNGTCVIVGNHGFSCKCKESFTGLFCNETYAVTKEPLGQKNAAIVGGVLGTLLVIVLIVGVVLYRKMQNDKEEEDSYANHRQRSVLSEMTRLGRRQNDQDKDIELHASNRKSGLARHDSGEYRRGFQEERMIPRVQTSRERNEYLDDRNVSSEPEMSRRPGQKESREEARNSRNVSSMQYKNRGYEEE